MKPMIIEEEPKKESVSKERKREQQSCRDYWARTYGIEAERKSRGGSTWI